jgi:hypothetical protein
LSIYIFEQISSNADKILNAGEIFHPNSEEEQGEQSLVVLYFNVTVTHIQQQLLEHLFLFS